MRQSAAGIRGGIMLIPAGPPDDFGPPLPPVEVPPPVPIGGRGPRTGNFGGGRTGLRQAAAQDAMRLGQRGPRKIENVRAVSNGTSRITGENGASDRIRTDDIQIHSLAL
jgi:hypothetical protein